MTIPASKVKSLCTESEANLVRASRKPVLDKLTVAQLKRHAERARKLFDKWHGLDRDQSRARRRKVGTGVHDTQTKLKVEIFREALQKFETRLVDLEGATTTPVASVSALRKQTSPDHRGSRVVVRQLMRAAEDVMQGQPPKKRVSKKQARPKKTTPAKSVQHATKGTKGTKATKARVSTTTSSQPKGSIRVGKAEERQAAVAAKRSRLERSGKTTRIRGHVIARGKRAQSRRDSRR